MIAMIICFIIVILIYQSLVLSINSTCVGENEIVIIKEAFGTRVKGIELSKRLGFPTVNIRLDKGLPCGFYEADSDYGPATFVVGKLNNTRAFINFTEFKEKMDKIERFKFTNLKRVVNNESDFVTTYNKGCCK